MFATALMKVDLARPERQCLTSGPERRLGHPEPAHIERDRPVDLVDGENKVVDPTDAHRSNLPQCLAARIDRRRQAPPHAA
jgi:hypothetical protein